MNQKNTIEELLEFRIPIDRVVTYKADIFWRDILAVEGLEPSDKLVDLYWKEQIESGFGSMKMEDELETYLIPMIRIRRNRPETDEEYSERFAEEEKRKKEIENKEWLEYLRLKGKFKDRKD